MLTKISCPSFLPFKYIFIDEIAEANLSAHAVLIKLTAVEDRDELLVEDRQGSWAADKRLGHVQVYRGEILTDWHSTSYIRSLVHDLLTNEPAPRRTPFFLLS